MGEKLAADGNRLLLVTEAQNRRYLSGFTGSAGWLIVSSDGCFLITDGRYWDQVAKQCPDVELFRYLPSEHESLAGALVALIQEKELLSSGGALTLETDGVSLSTHRSLTKALQGENLQLNESSGLITGLREIKDADEVEILKKAAHIADQALSAALAKFQPGQRECDLKAEIEYNILRLGGTSTSFSTIVASGPNGSYPHAGASERLIQEGELITIDFGALYQGYCSDMTRTIWYGELPEFERKVLSHTRKAQEKALAAARAGIKASALDAAARDHLESVELGEYFIHSLGHGVGLDIHEAPGLRKTNDKLLLSHQVVTIEPGVYIPGKTGCRVEDTILLSDTGCEVINRYPKQQFDQVRPPILEDLKAHSSPA